MNSLSISTLWNGPRASLRARPGWRFITRSWMLTAAGGLLALVAVGCLGSWALALGAERLCGAVLWLSGLVLLAGALESERQRQGASLAVSGTLVMLLAALGKAVSADFYIAAVWALAATALVPAFVPGRAERF